MQLKKASSCFCCMPKKWELLHTDNVCDNNSHTHLALALSLMTLARQCKSKRGLKK